MTKQFGKYQILSLLGQGGMGKVYRATNSEGKEFALKIASDKVMDEIKGSDKTKRRFEREALLAFQLEHPNIVRTFDIGQVDRTLYLACELMPKGSLQDLLEKQKTLSEHKALLVVHDVAKGLAELHKRNLIHRDIKPDNILFSADNTAKIADLGLLRTTDGDRSTLTKTGDFLGTPSYMSPEQLKGEKKLDIRCDLYSLGSVFYQCLAGNPPFYRGTLLEIVQQHICSPIPEIDTHPQIFSFIKKLLAKQAEDRLQTPSEALSYIDSLLKTPEITSATTKTNSAQTVISNSAQTVVSNSAQTVVSNSAQTVVNSAQTAVSNSAQTVVNSAQTVVSNSGLTEEIKEYDATVEEVQEYDSVEEVQEYDSVEEIQEYDSVEEVQEVQKSDSAKNKDQKKEKK